MAGCEDRGEEHDAVHGMSLEEFEVLELALGVVIGVGQEHLAAAFTQHLADTGGDAADGLGVDLGHDDADDARGTSAQRSGLRGGRVPGALDRLANPLALVIRQVAAVQIARHRSTGDACELRHFLDRHDAPPSLIRTMIPSVLHGSRRTRPQNGRVTATELRNRTRRNPPPPDFPSPGFPGPLLSRLSTKGRLLSTSVTKERLLSRYATKGRLLSTSATKGPFQRPSWKICLASASSWKVCLATSPYVDSPLSNVPLGGQVCLATASALPRCRQTPLLTTAKGRNEHVVPPLRSQV